VLSFFLVELDTTGAIDGSDRLLLRGRFPPKVIEQGLRKYIGALPDACAVVALRALGYLCDLCAQGVLGCWGTGVSLASAPTCCSVHVLVHLCAGCWLWV
jgi:hypothetical protein